MSHLLTPRKGWENEKLAAYLLSRFCFVAQPSSVADDLGSDFFCTIFEIIDASGDDVLLPRTSFAIQVKSSASDVSVDNKIDYLNGLEMPFFLGVVKQSPAQMDVYSAELLPVFFSEHGIPNRLWLRPVMASDFDANIYFEEPTPKQFRLRCPMVATLRVEDDRPALTTKVDALRRICGRAHMNIATKVGEEHIYDMDGKGLFRIMAGSGSVRFFRLNFVKRLAEYFKNLEWILRADHGRFSLDEFRLFESFYHDLQKLYGTSLPEYVSESYEVLKSKLTAP